MWLIHIPHGKLFIGWLPCRNDFTNVDTANTCILLILCSIKTKSSHMNKQEKSCSNTLSHNANINRNQVLNTCTHARTHARTHTHTYKTLLCSVDTVSDGPWLMNVEPDLSSPMCDTTVCWAEVHKSTETPRRVNRRPSRLMVCHRAKCLGPQRLHSVFICLTVASEGQSTVSATLNPQSLYLCAENLNWGNQKQLKQEEKTSG